jgi:hypothetical protein
MENRTVNAEHSPSVDLQIRGDEALPNARWSPLLVRSLFRPAWDRWSLRRPWLARLVRIVAAGTFASLVIGSAIGGLGALYGGGLLVAASLAYGILRSLRIALLALVAVIFLLPFAALPVDLGFSPTLLDLALVGVFFVWVCRIVSRRERKLVAPPPALGVLAFAVLAVIAFVAGLGHAPLTAPVVRRFGELVLGILTFFVIVNAVRSVPDLRWLAVAIVALATVEAIVGVALYLLPHPVAVRALSTLRVVRYPTGSEVLRFIEDNPDLPLRAVSTSIDPNVLGGALIFSTTIAVALFAAPRPHVPRALAGIAVAIMGACMILTFSRGSFAGLAAALMALVLLRYRRLAWIGLAAAGLLFLLPPAQVYVQHFLEGLRGEDLATQMRFGEYKDALILITRHPWLGVGFAGTPEIDTYLGVSNVYLLIAEEMGVLGLVAFTATLVTLLVGFLRVRRHVAADSPLDPLVYGTSVAVFGAMVGGLVDHYLFNLVFPHATTLLWLTAGMSASAVRLARLQSTA